MTALIAICDVLATAMVAGTLAYALTFVVGFIGADLWRWAFWGWALAFASLGLWL